MKVPIMRNIWWKSMISNAFKKQLIVNAYNTQLLPNNDEIHKISFNTIKRIKIRLLFKRDYYGVDKSLWVKYKYKTINIDDDIRWFLNFLTEPIYSIYQYSVDKEINIQKSILYDIKNTLEKKYNIEDSPDYTEYMEDIYD